MMWLAVGCLGLAVALLVPSPRARWRRLDRATEDMGGSSEATSIRRWLRGRPDAPSVKQRVLAALVAGGILALLVPGMTGLAIGLPVGFTGYVVLGFVAVPDPRHILLRQQLPDALDLLGACIEAGSPPSQAVDVVSAVSPPATRQVLERVAARFQVGTPPPQVWEELAGHVVWGDVARDLARSARSGTAVESALRVHADEARRRRHEAVTKAARAVGVKSVMPLMLCFLPAFILVGIVPIIAGLALSIFQ